MSDYHTITHSLAVKPVDEPIYSEMCSIIELVDEAAGLYVSIRQSGKVNTPGDNKICITAEEWPHIQEAVDRMFATIRLAEDDAK